MKKKILENLKAIQKRSKITLKWNTETIKAKTNNNVTI